jgi:hypothetical protein
MDRGRGEPKRPISSREQEALPLTNHLGSKEVGTAFSVGVNRWSAGTRSGRVLWESAGAEGERRKPSPITEKEESSEGRSP